MRKLTASNLKNVLWETLNNIKSGDIEASEADAVATQVREILRTTNTQLRISSQSKRNVPTSMIDFSEN